MKAVSLYPWPVMFVMIFIFSINAPMKHLEDQEGTQTDSLIAKVSFSNQTQLSQLAATYDIWEVNHAQGFVIAMLTPAEFQSLITLGFQVDIETEKSSRLNSSRQVFPDQPGGIPGFPCYRTVEETYASMQDLADLHPELAEWIDIGDSWEKWMSSGSDGYDLYSLVLTNKSRTGPKPRFFLMAAIHAREYATSEVAARFAELLVDNYGLDADITWLLDYYEVHILPISNPDGRKIAEGGIYWRKNVNNTDGCANPSMWGTDLNRNSSFKWGLIGSSIHACDETYRGSAPASETETQAIQDYLSGMFFDHYGPIDNQPVPADTSGIFITLHSYGNLIFFPWAWTDSPSPNHPALQTLGRKFGYYSGYKVCQSGDDGCLYQVSGNTDDWAYAELGVPAYTFEIGTSFFESCAYFEDQILEEQFPALIYAFKAARLPYQNPAGPDSIDLALSAKEIAPGAGLILTFSADDTRYDSAGWGQEPSQHIAGARYSIDAPPWLPDAETINLQPVDGGFDALQQTFQARIDTSTLSPGRHTIFIESQDAAGNWGVPSAIFFWITAEKFQPAISPNTRTAESSPLTRLAHDFLVINAGTQDDTFEIQLLGNTWPTRLSRSNIGPLIPGESRRITITVSIPETTHLGDQDLAVLVVSSRGDPGKISQAQITSMVREPMLYVPYFAKE